MTTALRPVLRRLLTGEPLPFEWVVTYAPDGDAAQTLRRAWDAADLPALMDLLTYVDLVAEKAVVPYPERRARQQTRELQLWLPVAATLVLATTIHGGVAVTRRRANLLRRLVRGENAPGFGAPSTFLKLAAHAESDESKGWLMMAALARVRREIGVDHAAVLREVVHVRDAAVACWRTPNDKPKILADALRAVVPCPTATALSFTLGDPP